MVRYSSFLENNLARVGSFNNCDYSAARSMVCYTLRWKDTRYMPKDDIKPLIFPQYRPYIDQYWDDIVKCMCTAYCDIDLSYRFNGGRMEGVYDNVVSTSYFALLYAKYGSDEFHELIKHVCNPPALREVGTKKICISMIKDDEPNYRYTHLDLRKPGNQQWPPEHLMDMMTFDDSFGAIGYYGVRLKTREEQYQAYLELLETYNAEYNRLMSLGADALTKSDSMIDIRNVTKQMTKLTQFYANFVEYYIIKDERYQLYVWCEVK